MNPKIRREFSNFLKIMHIFASLFIPKLRLTAAAWSLMLCIAASL